jgi:uncharacterized protein YndB with AHSA1/START domain
MTASELIKPAPTSLVIRRTFDAPVERVFNAWLTPDALRAFLVGTGQKVLDVKVDPRVGGTYAITWDMPDGPWVVGGAYREIVKNERIVCTWTWEEDDGGEVHESLLTLEFHSLGPKRSGLVLTHTKLRDEESRDGHAKGWQSAVDKLAEIIEGA